LNYRQSSFKILLPVLVLLTSIGAAWALIEQRPHVMPQAEAPAAPKVEILRAEPQTLRLNVMSQGVVAPREEIDLIAEVSGKVVQMHPALVSGGAFAANELLLTIDPRDYDYAVVAAQAKVSEAKRALISEEAQAEQALNEWQALGEGEASDLALRKPQLAEAEAKLKAAEAELAKARLDRSRCELRAPFAGRVLSKQAGRGQYLQSGSVAARIFASDIAEIRLPIGLDQLAFLDLPLGRGASASGQWPAVTLRAAVGGKPQHWQGRIVRSEAALDSASGQLYLVAQVEHPEQATPSRPPLLSGLFVQAEIEGVRRDGLFTLPRSALNSLQQAKLVDQDLRLEIRPLDVLRTEADRVIVTSGLKAGDRVVISEMPVPVAGMQVSLAASESENTR